MHMHHQQHDDPGDSPAELADTAGQSLADALRVSFRILTFVLFIVAILYLCSGIQKLEQNEKALVLRLGELRGPARGPGGLVWTFPKPFDQVITVPVLEKRTTVVKTQDIFLREGEDRSKVYRPGGLDPKLDGSIMTGDRGLVHARWIVTYEIEDLAKFVGALRGAEDGAETELIEDAVGNAAIAVIGQMDTVDVVRRKIGDIQRAVKRRAQEILTQDLETGIRIANIDSQPAWPVQTRTAFEQVTKASNEKSKLIDEAEQRATEILNGTAGAVHEQLGKKFESYVAAKSDGQDAAARALMGDIEALISDRASGQAGQVIQEARSVKKKILEDIQADALEYRAYLEEYQRNPETLLARLWYDTQSDILTHPGVSKRHLPPGRKEVRLKLGRDPVETRAREEEGLLQQKEIKGDFSGMDQRQRPAQLERRQIR